MTIDKKCLYDIYINVGTKYIGMFGNRAKSVALSASNSRHFTGGVLAVGIGLLLATDPAAAQEFSGGAEIESFLETFIPWALRWMLIIGVMVAVSAHIFAGWTSDPDKAFRRKEWRNRAFFGVALAIPALLILNAIITTFGGEAIDFLPFV